MSEKVGSGADSVEELEQEQVLLDWQDLPSFGGAEIDSKRSSVDVGGGAGAEAESDAVARAESLIETDEANRERRAAQTRGELLLRATASGNGLGQEQTIDTVLLRAEQALGREQFLDLTRELVAISLEKTPDEVMEKFRGEAQKYSTVDAGDLWEAVMRQAKVERFGGQRDEVKFYYSTSLEGLKEILQGGHLLKRKDHEAGPLKSDLRLSYDYRGEDGKWKSGFGDEREDQAREVTMVFDGALLDEEGFAAFGKNPTAEAIDWQKYCLGVVISDEVDKATARRVVKYNGGDMLPVLPEKYELEGEGQQDWGEKFLAAETMRMVVAWSREQSRRTQELSDKLYGHAADGLIRQNLGFFAERLAMPKLEVFYEKYGKMNTMEERQQMSTELVEYFGGTVFGVGTDTKLDFYNDTEDTTVAKCVPPEGNMRVNEARLENATWKDLAIVFGHEMQHKFQMERAKHYSLKLQDPKIQTTEYDELCYYNYMNYIEGKVDYEGYCRQFIEVEAYSFGNLVKERCEAVERKMRTPAEQVRRKAKALGGKIMEASQKMRKQWTD